MDKIKLYSPGQIGCGSLFLGGLAGLYMLKKNFEALGNPEAAKKTTIWSIIFALSLTVLICLLERFDDHSHIMTPLNIGFAFGLSRLAHQYQITKEQLSNPEIHSESEVYEFHSNWNVLKVSIFNMIVLACVVLVGLFFLTTIGSPDHTALAQP